jgi:hypothetical protein
MLQCTAALTRVLGQTLGLNSRQQCRAGAAGPLALELRNRQEQQQLADLLRWGTGGGQGLHRGFWQRARYQSSHNASAVQCMQILKCGERLVHLKQCMLLSFSPSKAGAPGQNMSLSVCLHPGSHGCGPAAIMWCSSQQPEWNVLLRCCADSGSHSTGTLAPTPAGNACAQASSWPAPTLWHMLQQPWCASPCCMPMRVWTQDTAAAVEAAAAAATLAPHRQGPVLCSRWGGDRSRSCACDQNMASMNVHVVCVWGGGACPW